jgi:hypothetical protein
MRSHERLGRAERAGTARGGRHAVLWQLTPRGAEWLAYRALNSLRDARDAPEAAAHARDLGVAAGRMLQFHTAADLPTGENSSASRTAARPADAPRRAGQWTVRDLAFELGMPVATLYGWIEQGHVTAEFGTRWIVHADDAEVSRLRELRTQPRPRAGRRG